MIIAVTGSGGMLGQAVVKKIERSPYALVAFNRKSLDITNRSRAIDLITNCGADILINCAAYTNVDKAEDEPELAMSVNADGAGYLAEACAIAGIRLVHISSDYVFDGSKGSPYTEDDPPSPVGAYAISKVQGGKNVMEHLPTSLVIRPAWLFGDGGDNFVSTMRRLARTQNEINVVNDQTGSPTFTDDLAEGILKLLDTNIYGSVHIVNDGFCTWYQFACQIMDILGLENVKINPITSKQYLTKAKRPRDSRLDTSLFTSVTGQKPRSYKDALDDYLTGYC